VSLRGKNPPQMVRAAASLHCNNAG
jgi:hypothetical protein